MPRVPLSKSHSVVIELFIKIFEKTNSLDDHGIYLLSGEAELISGKGVGETEAHSIKLFFLKVFQEISHLEPNASQKFIGLLSSFAIYAQFLINCFA